jgi:hypothetical protein
MVLCFGKREFLHKFMREKLDQQPYYGESWNDAYEKRRSSMFQEFDAILSDLNSRIIACLVEYGVNDNEKLNNLEKEGDDLEDQFDLRGEQEGATLLQQFGSQYRGLEFGFDDFERDRGFRRHDQHIKEVRRVMKQGPTINDLRSRIEELIQEAKTWRELQKKVINSGRKYLLNPISNAVYDKESEISSLARLLEKEVEKIKDASGDYVVGDLEKAKQGLEKANEIGMIGNNPNAGRARQQTARARLRTVEQALKQSGKVEKKPEEKLTEELDELYPNAKSKTVIEYQGKKYQIRYFPLESSRTGKTVFEWGHRWVPFLEEKTSKPKRKFSKK